MPWIRLEHLRLLENIAPDGRTPNRRLVLDDANLEIPTGRYMVVGSEADRRCFIDLLTGRRDPMDGRVLRSGVCSYPIGRVGPFSVPVTGYDMLEFLAVAYNFDAREAADQLEALLPWPAVLETRLDRASAPQRIALSIATAEFIDVDILLFDGSLLHPEFPEAFLGHVARLLPSLLGGRLTLLSSRQFRLLQPLAEKSIVIHAGRAQIVDGIVNPSEIAAASEAEDEQP
jgi:ABC-type polysaccharide/polyol phosphate transport system ATPase subunit